MPRLRNLPAVVLLLLAGGCAADPQADPARPAAAGPGSISAADIADGTYLQAWDWGSGWSDAPRDDTPILDPIELDRANAAAAQEPSGPVWTIVLQTFTGDGHADAARVFASRLPLIDTRLAAARIHSTPRGSKVMINEYEGPDDEQARADLKWVKSLRIDGRPIFRLPMFTRVNLTAPGRESPFALIAVRRAYPNVDPLYTLQIAVWGSFEGAMAWPEAKARAEKQVRALRAANTPAYVHHDDDKELSMITVGLFDYRALDAASGLFSPEVESLMRRFPRHLVNGEPVMELVDPSTTARGTRPQAPLLVLVPRL